MIIDFSILLFKLCFLHGGHIDFSHAGSCIVSVSESSSYKTVIVLLCNTFALKGNPHKQGCMYNNI